MPLWWMWVLVMFAAVTKTLMKIPAPDPASLWWMSQSTTSRVPPPA